MKRMIPIRRLRLALFSCLVALPLAAQLPEIKPVNDSWLLHVHGEPMLVISGHVMNSSSFDTAYMETVWPRMKALHLNTLILPISWQAVEPEEGVFDFSLVDHAIEQARQNDMKMVLAWFGTWKNGRSFYPPEYVMSDLERFPRMERAGGQRLEVLSGFSKNVLEADKRAFLALMAHLKEIDGTENTVLMVQIQNEVGLLGDSRDRSPVAEAAFAGEVPAALMRYLVANKDQLKPYVGKVWARQGYPESGSWSKVFGPGIEADEIFMAWHYARFIDHIAEAGQSVYPLPFYVNAWLGQERDLPPGRIPSGGPVGRVMDIWKAGAPHLALLAPDIYAFFGERTAEFSRADNPLFVPEAVPLWLGDRDSGGPQAFYLFGEAHGLGYAPFAIDHPVYTEAHPIGVAYAALQNLTPLIMEHIGTENLRAFYREAEETSDTLEIGPYRFDIGYQARLNQCYGMIIRTGENEFVVAGNGLRVRVTPANTEAHSGLSVTLVEEGRFDADGRFVRQRLVGGDEVMGTSGLQLPAHGYDLTHEETNMCILRSRFYLHPPRRDGAAQALDETPEF